MSEKANEREDGLPEGWTWTSLEQVCEVNPRMSFPEQFSDETPVSFVPMAAVDDVKGAIIAPKVRPIGEVWKGYTRFAEGDVIFAKITPCMENGKAAIAHGLVNGVGLGSTEFHVMRSSEAILPQWIYHFVRRSSFRGEAAAEMTGTAGQLRVPILFMREANIPLPPLPEQRRIVAEIETQFTRLDAAVAGLERAQTALERYRASVLQAACEGRLVPTEAALARAEGRDYEPADALLERILAERRARWEAERWEYEIERAKKKAAQAERKAAGLPYYIRELEPEHWEHRTPEEYEPYLPKGDKWKKKYDEPEPPDTEGLGELPEGWVWTTVEQLAAHEPNSITDGPFGSKLKTAHYTETGPRVIRLQNIGDGEFKDEKAHISQEHFETLRNHKIFPGDLVIAALGSSLPRACIIPKFVGPAVVKADCIRFKPHPDIGNVKYLNAVLNSELLKSTAANIVHGVGRPRMNQQEIKSLPVPIPPIQEQQRIADEVERRLSLVEALETAVAANLRRAERLRQSILKRAFEGRLVPQDPSDEPASALLARIQAERGRQQPKSQTRRKTRKRPPKSDKSEQLKLL